MATSTTPITPKRGQREQTNLSTSNAKTISNMENGNHDLKKYHLMNYIADLQK